MTNPAQDSYDDLEQNINSQVLCQGLGEELFAGLIPVTSMVTSLFVPADYIRICCIVSNMKLCITKSNTAYIAPAQIFNRDQIMYLV